MKDLDQKTCLPCKTGEESLPVQTIEKLLKEIDSKWSLIENKKIQREFSFSRYKDAIHFINVVAEESEKQGHHPEIFFTWGRVLVAFYTHKVQGLTENDFIMAKKTDVLFLSHFLEQ